MNASDLILKKALVASAIPSREWDGIRAALKDRAFFSARVEEERILYEARKSCAQIASGTLSESEARRNIRRMMSIVGHKDVGDLAERRTNLFSDARLNLILQQNVRSTRGYIQWRNATSEGALAAFPAQELVRLYMVKKPRDWVERWRSAGGKFFGGRMIALKNDPIWTRISRFGHPWPPFDFGSKMGVEDVSRSEAIRLGLLSEDSPPPQMLMSRDGQAMLNDTLQTTVPFNTNDPEWVSMRKTFGDQIQLIQNKASWRGEVIRKNFLQGNFSMDCGVASADLIAKLMADPLTVQYAKTLQNGGKKGPQPLKATQDWLNKKRDSSAGGGDHRAHFYPMTQYPHSKPLTIEDIELIPSIWRNPDRVLPGYNGAIVLEVDSLEGDMYRLIVGIDKVDPKTNVNHGPRQSPTLLTFYRTK